MKRKKIFVGLLAAAAVFGLTACKTDEETPPNPPVEVTTYTVTFDNNGHGTAPANLTEVSKLPTLPTLTDENYVFGGWYYDSACTKKAEAGQEIKENTKLYAKWTKKATEKFTVTFDSQQGSAVTAKEVEKGQKVTKPTDPTREEFVFKGWYKEAACTNAWNFDTDTVTKDITLYAKWEAEVVATKYKVYFHLTANDAGTVVEVEEGELVDEPTKPTDPYKEFTHWYTSATIQNEDTIFGFSTPIEAETHLYAGWIAQTEEVVFNMDYAKAVELIGDGSNFKTTSAVTIGKFQFEAGVYFESKDGGCVNNQQKKITFTVTGNGRITFDQKGATGNGSTMSLYKVVGGGTPDEHIKTWESVANGTTVSGQTCDLTPGTYYLVSVGSSRIYNMSLTEILEKSPTTGIRVINTNANYLLGRDFLQDGMSIELEYENGRKDLIDLNDPKITVIVPEDFKTSAGAKSIEVRYALNEQTIYTDTISVNVCEVEEIVLYDYVLDSSRITKNLQKLFAINGTFNHDNLVVKAKCLLPETTDKFIEFILTTEEFSVTSPTLDTIGNKSVSIAYTRDTTKTADYNIEVVTIPNLSANTEVVVWVDPDAEISTVGDNYNLHTINDALQFLKLAQVADNATKTISLMMNTIYKEKVEIDMPNVVLTTGNFDLSIEIEPTYENVKELFDATAVIEFNALNGLVDPSGTTTYSTDGSATISIRPEAENFMAQFVSFKNSYNTAELYEEAKKVAGSGTQGVAALVQADKAQFFGCYFTGYQDTLYAQIGRQYYNGCLIEGHTDYIFGYNATAYFLHSLIRTIGVGATEAENSNYNNGGYIVSTKGHNKGDADAIKYGYVFDECLFIADDKTADGSVSIARGWDKNMAVMVMYSQLDAHISKEAYGEVTPTGKNMNDRYGKMNAAPNPALLLEYGNVGEGAISVSLVDTCTVVTEEVAAEYGDLNVIFGAVNGKVNYGAVWNPVQEQDATIVLKTSDGTVLATLENFGFVGATITEDELKGAFNVPDGLVFEGFYADAACTTKYDFATILEQENVIYVKFVDSSVLTPFSVVSDSLADGDITTDISWGTNGIITIKGSSGKFTVDANSKNITDVNGKEVTTTKRLKGYGAGRIIEIDLSKYSGKAEIEVFAITSSSSDLTRGFKVVNSTGTQIGENYICNTKDIMKFTITLDCGQVYKLEGIVNGINYYGINVRPVENGGVLNQIQLQEILWIIIMLLIGLLFLQKN